MTVAIENDPSAERVIGAPSNAHPHRLTASPPHSSRSIVHRPEEERQRERRDLGFGVAITRNREAERG